MKNLRKALSLALAVALSLSLVIVAGAKTLDEYTDKASINPFRLEAVDLLTALGVFEGDESGALDPQGTFTRAQAAKIVSYITIGASASNLAQAPTDFSDVPASHWASGYVSFAAQRGIINGVGGGKFDPDSPVTGAQLAKLLLVAIGYGAKGEYVGASWELNSIIDGQRLYILLCIGEEIDFSAPATRQQAIQYVYNALSTQIVSYNQLFDAYLNAKDSDYVTRKQTNLAMESFSAEMAFESDDFGYLENYWVQLGVRKTANYASDIVIGSLVSNPDVTKGSLYSQYQWDDYVELWINGWKYNVPSMVPGVPDMTVYETKNFVERGSTSAAFANIKLAPAHQKELTIPLNGVHFDLIDTYPYDGKIGKIVAQYEYLAKVTRVNTASDTVNANVYDTFSGTGRGTRSFENIPVDDASLYTRDQYIVLTPKNNSIGSYAYNTPTDHAPVISVKPATVVTATPTRYTTVQIDDAGSNATTDYLVNSVTLNGEKKWVTATENLRQTPPYFLEFVDGTFYLDSYGNVIGIDSASIAAMSYNYLYLSGVATNFGASTFADNRASVTLSDGTKSVVEVAFKSDAVTQVGTAGLTVGTSGWFTYTVNADGKYVINALPTHTGSNTPYAYNIELTQGTGYVDTGKAAVTVPLRTLIYTATSNSSSNTSLYFNSTTALKVNGRSYTGYANFASFTSPADNNGSAITAYGVVIFGAQADGRVDFSVVAGLYITTTKAPSSGIYGIVMAATPSSGGAEYNIITLDDPDAELIIRDPNNNSVDYAVGAVVELSEAADGTRTIASDANVTASRSQVTYADANYVIAGGGIYYIDAKTLIYDSSTNGDGGIDANDYIIVYADASEPTAPAYAIVIVD
jgi:hypothetical protein